MPATGTDQTRIEADLNASRCIILILSAAANDSAVVAETVKAGVAKGKPVFPVRAEEILPSPELELYVSSTEWIDASSNALVDRLDKLVRGGGDTAATSNQEPPTKSSSGKLIGATPRRASAAPSLREEPPHVGGAEADNRTGYDRANTL